MTLEEVHPSFEVEPRTELASIFMIVKPREGHRASLPAITLVDGSARAQTVSTVYNEEFHPLPREVCKITDCEMVLSTSFNVQGQPIVNTPRKDLETYS
ncbi:MAG: hypothetical protein J2P21_18070 [Chloracidobacterium sp.]|nr:hypothetical protein [Chloracidobacterium sp.]